MDLGTWCKIPWLVLHTVGLLMILEKLVSFMQSVPDQFSLAICYATTRSSQKRVLVDNSWWMQMCLGIFDWWVVCSMDHRCSWRWISAVDSSPNTNFGVTPAVTLAVVCYYKRNWASLHATVPVWYIASVCLVSYAVLFTRLLVDGWYGTLHNYDVMHPVSLE